MRHSISCCMIVLLLIFTWTAHNAAQETPKEDIASSDSKTPDTKTKPEIPPPKEESSVTDHKIIID